MSAWSCWVTCGIRAQLRARLAPEIFWIRDSGLTSISPNLAKSTFGQGSRLRPLPAAAVRAEVPPATAAPPASASFTCFCTSSLLILPARSLPLTWVRSTPSSRANRRTVGLACGTFCGNTESALNSTGGLSGGDTSGSTPGLLPKVCGAATAAEADCCCSISRWASLSGSAATATGSTVAPVSAVATSDVAAAGAAATAAGFVASPAAASIIATTEPSDSESPSFTFSSLTTPANGAGTSSVALSDSSVIRPWSLLTESPTATRISMTGTSL